MQIDILHGSAANLAQAWRYFPLANPAIVTLPLAFVTSVLVSLAKPEQTSVVKFYEMRDQLGATSVVGA